MLETCWLISQEGTLYFSLFLLCLFMQNKGYCKVGGRIGHKKAPLNETKKEYEQNKVCI